jgi:trimeric autotransporter adhesin
MLSKMTQHLSYANVMATLALFVALGGGAYAASELAKDSVGPKQLKKNAVTSRAVKNGQVKSVDVANEGLTGADIKDGAVKSVEIGDGVVTGPKLAAAAVGGAQLVDGAITSAKIADGAVGSSDLDPNTVGDIISIAGTLTSAAPPKAILTLPGFGKFTMGCTAPDGANLFYSLEKGAQQNARLYGHDSIDNTPVGAAAIASDKGGGVGYGGSGHIAAEGTLFVFTGDDRVLSVDWSLSNCVYRVRATLDRNDA